MPYEKAEILVEYPDEFFVESLSTFEMTQRGYREAQD